MKSMKLLTPLFVASTVLMLSAQNPPPPPPTAPPQGQQPSAIGVLISGRDDGAPPKMAVPEFIPLGKEPEVIAAAKTIADVLWDDLAYEKEFYMLPRDILRTVPTPASVEAVSMDRWKELGAEGLVVGTVHKTADGIVVEARLLRVVNGAMALGKQYTGSARSLADGGRVYAHGIADEIHKQQRNLRGVARTKLAFSSDRDGARMKGPVAERDVSNIYMADYDGANQTRLTATRSLDIAPAWSPDGDSLAYTLVQKRLSRHHPAVDSLASSAHVSGEGLARESQFPAGVVARWHQAGLHVEPGRQSGDLRRQPRRQQPPPGHEPPERGRDADVVADRHAAGVHLGS